MALADEAAQIKVWKLDPATFEVVLVSVPAAAVGVEEICGWAVVIDDFLKNKLRSLRQAKLPNETGGVLLGFFDHEARRVYLVGTTPSPPDSKEWPTLYIRGSERLAQDVGRVTKVTAGNVEYIGEWHSHPESCSCRPSRDDVKVFAWLTEHMADEGQPALMAIVGDPGPCLYLGLIIREGERAIPSVQGSTATPSRRYLPAFIVVLPAWLAFALWFPPDKLFKGVFASAAVTRFHWTPSSVALMPCKALRTAATS